MGNFSRNTFDPVKNYVAVRLQQGVPVLDADWNELNDVTRHELYDAFSLTFTDGIQPHGSDFEVLQSSPGTNDFSVLAGAALIRGRPIRVRQNLRYATQPWTDPKRAARDGVAVIPPLTTPTGPAGAPPRTDIVYVDVWEREVGSVEDANLINPAIGVETCVRLKREVAVRVTEGATTLPNAPAEHVFLPLARLRRPVNQAEITAQHIEDMRPFFHSPQGTRVVSFFPAFLPITDSPYAASGENLPTWHINPSYSRVANASILVPKYHAFKTHEEAAAGILPLTLPDGARLSSFRIAGTIFGLDGKLQWQLIRLNQRPVNVLGQANLTEFFDILIEDTIRAASTTEHVFGTTYSLGTTDPKCVVDNSRYAYILLARTFDTPPYDLSIQGVSISYEYFGLLGPPTH